MHTERDLFEKAIKIQGSVARTRFLEEQCDNPAALERVIQLVDRHFSQGDFDLEPDSKLDETQNADDDFGFKIGSMVGPYRLMEQIGRGGMGIVYVADQTEPVRRRVALKIIKPGMDSREIVNRFDAERQALAMMDHPHIARVLDAGATESGRPYFVMELVRGVPITQFCDTRKLSSADRLKLFIDVCQAIQHAHQKGIIHRDIKPGNVLVTMHDDKAVAKVIDFGVAKAIHQPLVEGTIYTKFSQMVGTPLYMSPEQAEMSGLDIDTRTDIYSLGVLLYELLTGDTPFDRARMKKAAFDEMRRIIREEDPPSPSSRISSLGDTATSVSQQRGTDQRQLTQQLKGDLDWIVLKALEKDRKRRYETASEFALDVQRHLQDEPVMASPPSRRYKMQKFVRRNRRTVVSVGFILATLLVAVTTSTGALFWALQENKRANEALTTASEERKNAVAQANSALESKKAADRSAKQAKKEQQEAENETIRRKALGEFLIADLLWQADPTENQFADQITVLQLLDKAAERIDGSKKLSASPKAEMDVRIAIGNTYYGLGRYRDARKHLEKALAIAEKEFGLAHRATLFAMNLLSLSYQHLGLLDESEKLLVKEIEGRKSLDEDPPDLLGLYVAYNNLAELKRQQGFREEAEKLHRQNLENRTREFGDNHIQTYESVHNLGAILLDLRRYEEAEPLLRRVLLGREGHPALGPEHPTTNTSRHALSVALRRLKKHEEALVLMKKALQVTQKVEGPEHPHAFTTMNTLGALYLEFGKLDEAEKFMKMALAGRLKAFDPGHSKVTSSHLNLGEFYLKKKQFAESSDHFKKAYANRLENFGEGHSLTNGAGGWYVQSLIYLEKHEEARVLGAKLIEQALAKQPDPRKFQYLYSHMVRSYKEQGDADSADQWKAKFEAQVKIVEGNQRRDSESGKDPGKSESNKTSGEKNDEK